MISADSHRLFGELVEAARRIVLTTHINPDGDALGSQISLGRFLVSAGKLVQIVNQDPAPEILSYLEDPALPVESYDAESHEMVLRDADLVILVDNSAPDRLGSMEPAMDRVAAKTLCIDHHPTRDAPWAHNIVDVESCATTVMIFELTRGRGWTPDLASAEAIYVGLATDTGFFRFNSTNAHGHDVAAALLRLGVRPARAYREVYERNSVAFTRLLGHALADLRLDAEGAIASVTLDRQLIERLGAENEDTSEITTVLLALDGVLLVVLFRELDDRRVKVSLRSKGDLDVHQLATEFGGGGHRNASGIVLTDRLEKVVPTILARAESLVAL
jgi:phosphoesterase RecJ-like protein